MYTYVRPYSLRLPLCGIYGAPVATRGSIQREQWTSPFLSAIPIHTPRVRVVVESLFLIILTNALFVPSKKLKSSDRKCTAPGEWLAAVGGCGVNYSFSRPISLRCIYFGARLRAANHTAKAQNTQLFCSACSTFEGFWAEHDLDKLLLSSSGGGGRLGIGAFACLFKHPQCVFPMLCNCCEQAFYICLLLACTHWSNYQFTLTTTPFL